MVQIVNKYNYYVRTISILAVLLITHIGFFILLPDVWIFAIPSFFLFFRLFIYVNITERIIKNSSRVVITSHKLFFFRKIVLPSKDVYFKVVDLKSKGTTTHALEVIIDGRIVYEVYSSEGFSKADFESLATFHISSYHYL